MLFWKTCINLRPNKKICLAENYWVRRSVWISFFFLVFVFLEYCYSVMHRNAVIVMLQSLNETDVMHQVLIYRYLQCTLQDKISCQGDKVSDCLELEDGLTCQTSLP